MELLLMTTTECNLCDKAEYKREIQIAFETRLILEVNIRSKKNSCRIEQDSTKYYPAKIP